MLCLNLRRGESTVFFGAQPEWSEVDGAALTPTQVAARLAGKRVCILVHGYNVKDGFSDYARLAMHLSDDAPFGPAPWYDEIIGVEWPGSKLDLAFWLALMRAGKAGRRLADALIHAVCPATLVDIEGHSLGCMVALEALSAGLRCRNLILTAAAVDNESIQAEERYWIATHRADRVLVAYSRHDPVLAGAYRIAMADRALGLTGPQNPKKCAGSVSCLDLSAEISRHGDYKRCPQLFDAWRSIVT